ncbi:MAG: hypothetical protein MJY72_08575 [Bacteroidales bacterium]|nr:hypothetical protein [Bacteroidales bacterium]
MRKTVHLCLASHDEVLFRSEEDFIRGFNSFAIACRLTETRALADGEMSDHVHFVVATDNATQLGEQYRYEYTRYFNNKYHRLGRFGDREIFNTDISGARHLQTAVSYVNRQGLHHGICSTPFEYKHCSANVIYAKELGKDEPTDLLPLKSYYRFVPKSKVELVKDYRMSSNGLLLRQDVIDTSYVEELYITPRNYLFNMNRITNDDWMSEQVADSEPGPAITLDSIERHYTSEDVKVMLQYENGRVNRSWMTDIELCTMIDRVYLPRLYPGRESIYQLSDNERWDLGNRLISDCRRKSYLVKGLKKFFTQDQVCRCLAVNRNNR